MNYAIKASLFGQFVAVPRNIVRTCRAVMILSSVAAIAFLQSPASLDAAEAEQASRDATTSLNLVPWPRTIQLEGGRLVLREDARIAAENAALLPLGQVLSDEIHALSGRQLKAVTGSGSPGDIVLRLLSQSPDEAYILQIDERAIVEGGNYGAVALGTTTLLQLLQRESADVVLPRLTINDQPHSAYRGLLIDVARQYHCVETLRQCVQLCRLYKIHYLQLHLTDDQAFTFPSEAYPRLTTQNWGGGPAYTRKELEELESYAAARGVAIVPEFEVPGHAGAMNRTMPELFKIEGTKPYEHHATINFANPDVLRAVDTIVGEMCDVFRSSPYFHIGGDEADFVFAHQHPDFQAAFKKFGLDEQGQWQLYRHFLIQMDEIVKKRGKQMIVWEGFHRDPDSQFQIPQDVIVMEYECPFYPPRQLVEDGYSVVNACWTPLYVVNQKRWSPRQIYDWNLYRLGQHTTSYALTTWHQLEATPQIIGGQMCTWEQPEAIEVASLRTRLPAMSERIWNPDAGRTYDDYAQRAAATDQLLSKLIPTVRIRATGLAAEDRDRYDVPRLHEPMTVILESELPAAEIRYTLDGQPPKSSPAVPAAGDAKPNPAPPATSSRTYCEPIVIDKTTMIRAAAYDADGKPVGYPTGEVFYYEEKLEPNLATGKSVTVSGGTQSPQNPEFAVDGKADNPHDSWWAGPAPQWLQVDLGQVYQVDRVRVYPYWDGIRCYQYAVEASTDTKSWKLVVDRSDNKTAATPQGDDASFPACDARYIRVKLLNNSANDSVHLVELMVFEAAK